MDRLERELPIWRKGKASETERDGCGLKPSAELNGRTADLKCGSPRYLLLPKYNDSD
jgi:hypothetical protein